MRPSLWRLPWGKRRAVDAGARRRRADCGSSDGTPTRTTGAATPPPRCSPPCAGDLRAGCVVLAHDGLGPGALRDGCAETVALVGALVRLARRARPGCVPVGENGAVARVSADRCHVHRRARDRRRRAPPRAIGSRTPRSPTTPSPRSSGPARSSPGCRSPSSSPSSATSRAPTPPSPRIVDGHLNAVERLAVHAEPTRCASRADRGRRASGCASASGAPTRGPARASPPASRDGGAARASRPSAPAPAGCSARCRARRATAPRLRRPDRRAREVDASWFAGAGMRASASHRVVFDGAPVLAVLGAPGAIAQEPWFARDAVRTAATWAGAADAAADEAMRLLADAARAVDARAPRRRPHPRRAAARSSCGSPSGGRARATPAPCGARTARTCAHAIADAAPRLLDEAARACGSRPFATGGGARPRPPRPRAVHAPAPPRPDRRARRRSRAGGGPVSVDPATFERMYREDEDPWGFATSAYERGEVRPDDRGARRPALPPRASSSAARSAC